MAKKDKPTPINREQFLDNLHDSYQIPEQSLQPYDNSNPEAKYTKPGQPEFLRGNEISMKGDETSNIRISLEDHDETILYYIQNNINPTVEINGNKREVPVIYGSPERWKSIQKDGFYRDKNGKIQTPLIILKRESFEKNRSIGNKLDGNKVQNVQYFKEGYSKRNSYDNFSVLQNQIPSVEYKVGIIPDYITITYKLIIFTDYVEHMNQLIEAIEFASDSYWGDKERFMFRAAITSFPTPIEVESGNDRASKSELTLTINGYIIPDTVNVNNAAPSPKSFNVTKLIFKEFFEESQSVQRNVPVGSKKINIYNPQTPSSQNITYYGNFSGSFSGDGSGLINLPFPSGSTGDTSSLVTTSSFYAFTSSYYDDSSSFDNRINNINVITSSFITFSTFNNFTSSYNTGSFTGSFIGDGSQLTGIASSKWTGSGANISRQSNVSITGSLSNGFSVIASGSNSHAEGQNTQALGQASHAEGLNTIASGSYSHVEGFNSIAFGDISHAEGAGSYSFGNSSHAEGQQNIVYGTASHVEGYQNIVYGDFSHGEGYNTITSGNYQHVQGVYNIPSTREGAFIIGNGLSTSSRSNLLFASGSNIQITGSLNVTQGITSSLFGTSSHSITASYAPMNTGSLVTTSSFNNFTSSYNTGSFLGNLIGTSSYSINSLSSSYVPNTSENLVKIIESSGEFEFSFAHATTVINNKIIIGTREGLDSKLLRYDGVILEEIIFISCDVGIESFCKQTDNSRLYFPYKLSGINYIVDVNPLDFTDINYNVITGVNFSGSPAIITDDVYIYGVEYLSNPKIFKIRISDWSVILTNVWNGASLGHSAQMGTTNFAITSVNGRIAQVSLTDLTYIEHDLSDYVATVTDDFVYLPDSIYGSTFAIVGGEFRDNNTGKGGVIVDFDFGLLYEFLTLPTVGLFLNIDGTKLYSTSNSGFIQEWLIEDLLTLPALSIKPPYKTYTYRGNGYPNEFMSDESGNIYITNWDVINNTSFLYKIELNPVINPLITERESYFINLSTPSKIGELNNVIDNTTTSSFGDLLLKSGSQWINSKQLTGSYGLTGSLQANSFTGSLFGTSSHSISSSYSTTSSYSPDYVSISSTGSMLQPYILASQTSSMSVLSSSFSLNTISGSIQTQIDTKQTNLIKIGYQTNTGVTGQTVISSLLIPANWLTSGDGFEIIFTPHKSVTASSINFNVYHDTTINGITNAIATGLSLTVSQRTGYMHRVFVLDSTTLRNQTTTGATSMIPISGNTVGATTSFNPAVNNYITITGNPTVVSETFGFNQFYIRKL